MVLKMRNLHLKRAIVIISQLLTHAPHEKDITSVCMFCDKLLRGPESRKYLSHGICNECLEEHYPEVVDAENDYKQPAVARLSGC